MPEFRRIIDNPDNIRAAIHRNTVQALSAKFPIETKNFRLDLKNIEVKHEPLSHNKQRKIIMARGNASDGVMVDLDLVDLASGKVALSLRKHRLVNLPYYTNRYTFILDGNEYSIVNQLRTKSGVYTRKRGNDTLEASFNLEKGANFKLLMSPSTGKFQVEILHSTLPLFALLKVLGADTQYVQQAIGEDLYLANHNITDSQMDRTINTLFQKLVKYKAALGDTASRQEKITKIREYFSGTKISEETTRLTLGNAHSKVDVTTLVEAAKKILRVYNDDEDIDERDNLEFQKVYSVEDIVKEVIDKSTTAVAKIQNRLNTFRLTGDRKEDLIKLKSILSPTYLTQPLRNFITTSSLSRMPTQINALEMLDTAATVTRLGEGAIGSESAVPDATRAVNYSYMGTIDPIATPESSKVGIDNRFTIGALKGDDNELYQEVVNLKNGKTEYKRVIDLVDSYVGMPDEIHRKGKSKPSDSVPAIHKGKLARVKRSQLEYQIESPHDLHTITANSLPFLNANQANRIVMGSKHITQAMPLKNRETRLVEASMDSLGLPSTMDIVGGFLEPKSPVDGIVSKIDNDYIYIKDKEGKTHKADYQRNTPLASKTMLHNELHVRPGDKVQRGQPLGNSNFTKDGKLALGRNLKVAYMPYRGLNHEDGIVVSEAATKKMTSVHSHRITVTLDSTMIVDKEKYAARFPATYTKEQLNKIDATGIAKKDAILQQGDPVVLVLSDASESRKNQVLGNLHKSLIHPYRDESEVYSEKYPAEVIDVIRSGKTISVLLKIEKPAALGDKLAGSYGNKGVIAHIEKDELMPIDESGEPVDAILTSAGVIGRINPAQTLESSLGKIAKKTGKPYSVENFSKEDYVKFVQDELKKHKVKDKENLLDPATGKIIPQIFTGVQHMHKLFKTTDTNFAGRGVDGPHDQDDSPVGSGLEGPKALGGMEVNALLGHNARSILKESAILRGSKNMDYWSQFQYGGIPQIPISKKSFEKFVGILRQAGVKTEREGDSIVAGPLTDKDVLELSSGEIRDGRRLDAKLRPEPGGLFDEHITGGLGGTKWSHIRLAEPVMNPVFEDCIRSLLGLSSKEIAAMFRRDGGKALRDKLNKIDVQTELADAEKSMDDTSITGNALDKVARKVKYLRALKEQNLKAGDAYMLENIPITPPTLRPITIGKTGDKLENDSNLLYRNLILENDTFKKIKQEAGLDEETAESRIALQNSVRELVGTIAPQSKQLRNSGVKGALTFIAGDQPKRGYFQNKVIYSKMNLSGRATISPDTSLGLDEIGLPEDMAWSMYRPFILRQMTQMGYSVMQARKEVEDRSDLARQILEEELSMRPVLLTRSPTLWKNSIMAATPKLRPGKNLQINTLWESAVNSDFDGDAMTIHLPVSDAAIQDAHNMMPSKLIFSDKRRGDLLMVPKQEPIVGLYKVTRNIGKSSPGMPKKFSDEASAWKAYHAGKLKATDYVDIG